MRTKHNQTERVSTVESTEAQASKPATTVKPTRKARIPMDGSRNILTVKGKEPGFRYRIVNDEGNGDRVQRFMDAGYEVVTHAVQVGDSRVDKAGTQGSPIELRVGNGKRAYLMRISEEYAREDDAAKARRVDVTEETIRSTAKEAADYGKVSIDFGK